MLVFMMKEYNDASKYRAQNGWTKEGWNCMAARLNKQYPRANFTLKQVKDREQRLKRDYAIVKSILEKSGFGWDPDKNVATAIDEKWEELSQDQRKWRYKEFPYYDDLHGIYEGKTAEGKRCIRTTDVLEEKYSSSTFVSHGETFTDQILGASGLDSPSPTLPAPGLGDGDFDWDRNTYGDDVELSYDSYPESMGNNGSQFGPHDNDKLPESPPVKKAKHSKGSDEGKHKKGKDAAMDNLVAARKEELETYKELKTKQIESYRDMKMAQMEKNDPDKDPYCIGNCIDKLKNVGDLTASEKLKMIDYLKEKRVDREIFMKVEHDVVLEMYKKVLGREV
ncbi:unnamed protein product [Alopecurus aequalis]